MYVYSCFKVETIKSTNVMVLQGYAAMNIKKEYHSLMNYEPLYTMLLQIWDMMETFWEKVHMGLHGSRDPRTMS